MLVLSRLETQKIHVIGAITRHVITFAKWTDRAAAIALLKVSRYKDGELADISEWVIAPRRPRFLWVDEVHKVSVSLEGKGRQVGSASIGITAPENQCQVLRDELLTREQASLSYRPVLRSGREPFQRSKPQPGTVTPSQPRSAS